MPKLCIPPKLCMPPELCMPPKPPIEWAGSVTGAASIANTTAHPIVILRSMTILPTVTNCPAPYRETAMLNVQMTNNLISDASVTSRLSLTMGYDHNADLATLDV